MKVRLTTDRVGYGWEQREGQVRDLPEAEAAALIRAGQAEPAPKTPADDRRPAANKRAQK